MSGMTEADLEQRSGLPGLGGRPRLHPSWGEAGQSAPPVGARQPLQTSGARPWMDKDQD